MPDFSWLQYVTVYVHFWQLHVGKHLYPVTVALQADDRSVLRHAEVSLRSYPARQSVRRVVTISELRSSVRIWPLDVVV